ncbi:Hypothetical protein YaeJ with similarity to translation release factor [Bathymodiolus thermophilus thioautotrophic gill symbiont]|uniref:Peptidyl-tRNA hydrolase n=2 Tax=Bathymodiolus thermophilus thioautotrophic gill symbiont TaxID=2360 RepID=A0A1J5TUH2_9GAMM|nr:peptidyl-tRNA hydrolase [Bathymodiolus thermophilus thioautotrophic gill symbiont]OIR23812.1 hypothetical protein BGC33_08235 [Bathymodiolus thermophilus thioautotrophic gill symbiont]SGZ99173.1 Hypothetical protein YaeJ with similarity to translation release factor [Bathymodiolus thermophilus thioautotrophic gill symbiont]
MLVMPKNTLFKPNDVAIHAIRSRGKGGQNVNKVNTGIHLRFDIKASSLTSENKEKLLKLNDIRLSKEGIIVIKADNFRTQEKNRLEALKRLNLLLTKTFKVPKIRKPTKISKAALAKQIKQKIQRSKIKQTRKKVRF